MNITAPIKAHFAHVYMSVYSFLVYLDLYIRSVYLLDFIKIFFKLNVVVGVDGPKLVNNFTPKKFYSKTKTAELTFFLWRNTCSK